MEDDVLKLKEEYHETWTTSLNFMFPLRRRLTLVPLVELLSGRQIKSLEMLSGKVLKELLKHLKTSFQTLLHGTGIVLVVRVRQQRRMFRNQTI